MKTSFGARLYFGFSVALLLCAVSGITSYFILQKQQKQRTWVRRSLSILDTTNRIQTLVIEMETGRRGFRSTNQKKFLEPYIRGLNSIAPCISELKNLLGDDSRLMKEGLLLENRIGGLISFYRNNGDDAEKYTRAYITKLTDAEKIKVDEIRGNIATIQNEEKKLLIKRREDYDQLVHYGTFSTIVNSVVSEIIIFILILIIIRELRSRRKARRQLTVAFEQLKAQTNVIRESESALKIAMDELGKINKQLEKFVYTVAHDIKSPLSGIIGSLSVLSDDEDIMKKPDLAELTDLSHTASFRLLEMVNTLLEYSRISLTQQPLEPVDIKELLEEMAVLLFPPKNIQIKIAPVLPSFNTRKLKIQQVFQNLISNAIKYNSKENGLIEIGYADKGNFYEFFVKDNGQGIAGTDKEQVFALMKTAGNKSSADSSTGFGLNIVKLLIEEQGGKIWYNSVVSEGSTFYFEWPK